MPLIDPNDTVRIELPADGEWVDARARLSRGDQIAVQRAIIGHTRVRPGSVESIDVDASELMDAAEFAILDVAIRAWSFPVAVTPENIRRLDEESVDAIKERLNELYPVRSEEEKKDLSGSGPTPLSVVEPSPASLAG